MQEDQSANRPEAKETSDARESFVTRYESGDLPWDDALPPPEVQALARLLPPGRALDLGCGFGRAAIFLARLGWQVTGIDFVPRAIAVARRRAAAAGVEIAFYEAPVTDLGFLEPPFDLALDVGCLHSLDAPGQAAYAAALRRLLPDMAYYLLFARIHDPDEVEEASFPRPTVAELEALFAEGFTLTRTELGRTAMPDRPAWSSAWFWWRRDAGDAPASPSHTTGAA